EADRLEKEYIENDDPNKTVNHSFIEGFNYALVNLQAIEELELNDNQKIVLEWLKSETILTREAPILSVNAFSDKNLLGKLPDVGRSGMRKAIKENFKYIYLMMSLIMVIIFGLNNEFVKAAVTGIFAFEYIKIMMLSELSEYLKTSVIILYKGDESEVSE
ncbi:hypothetical protein OS140_15355, partial [Enterococcus sp. E4-185]|nr:hypothetical protein [Enterococcus sp. E4-185]